MIHQREKPIGILLVEDNPTDVLLVQSQIAEMSDFYMESVELLSKAMVRLEVENFDIVLLDLNLPDAVGLEGLVKLRRQVQHIPVVVLTGVDDEQLGIMALQRGAQDYLIKGSDNSRLVRSMRYAIERMRAPGLQEISETSDNRQGGMTPKPGQYEVLTERELQVLKLLGKGSTNQEIVECLNISLTTVKSHISSILRKLAVSDRTKAVVEAFRQGLI